DLNHRLNCTPKRLKNNAVSIGYIKVSYRKKDLKTGVKSGSSGRSPRMTIKKEPEDDNKKRARG
ncbi:MAG: hypothetical protein J6X42_00175, partial [Alphaproteobacteria bacterium]|nr:hypothetical protein [Alphaproteobacteria bacterium]